MIEQKNLSLTYPMKTPKSQLTAKQPLTEKTRTYKIDILHPKTKKQPQWDSRRGTFTTESNLIPARLETHKLENNLPGSPT